MTAKRKTKATAYVYHDSYEPPSREELRRRGDYAARQLIPMAEAFVVAVHEEDRDALRQRLDDLTVTEAQGVIVTLAAMVDPDRSRADLLAWVDFDEHGRRLDQQQHAGNANLARLEAALKEAS